MTEEEMFRTALERCAKTDDSRHLSTDLDVCWLTRYYGCNGHLSYGGPENYATNIVLHFKDGSLVYAEGWGE